VGVGDPLLDVSDQRGEVARGGVARVDQKVRVLVADHRPADPRALQAGRLDQAAG